MCRQNNPCSILVVDDEEHIRELFATAYTKELTEAYLSITVVSSLAETFDKLKEQDFDAILLDLNLKNESKGIATLKAVIPNTDAFVFAFTGEEAECDMRMAKEIGAKGYFVKGKNNIVEIINILHFAAGQRRARILEAQSTKRERERGDRWKLAAERAEKKVLEVQMAFNAYVQHIANKTVTADESVNIADKLFELKRDVQALRKVS